MIINVYVYNIIIVYDGTNEYFMIVLFYDILLYISSSHSLLPLKYVDVPFTSLCNLFVFPLKVSCR